MKREKDQGFHDRLKSAMISKCNAQNYSWTSYYGDLLFPTSPSAANMVSNLFNDTTKALTHQHIATIIDDLGSDYIYLLTQNKTVEVPTEQEFNNIIFEEVGVIGQLCTQLKDVLNGDGKLDSTEGKKLLPLAQKLMGTALTIYLQTQRAKNEGL